MKLPEHLIIELMKGIAEDMSIPLVLLIKDRENVNEFKIAEKLGMTVNEVRHHLYKLSEHALVSSIRKKDKKKGWHISYWTFHNLKARNFLIDRSQHKIIQLKDEIEKEKQGNYYVCPNRCTRTDYISGLENNFTCQECGAIMTPGNVKRRIADLEKEVEHLQKIKHETESFSDIKKPVKEVKESKKKQPLKKKTKVLHIKATKKSAKKIKLVKKNKPASKKVPPPKKVAKPQTFQVNVQPREVPAKKGLFSRILRR